MNKNTRIEKDSMGELAVPATALYGPQTQRAVNNFPISGLTLPRNFIRALGLVKYHAARVNTALNLLADDKSKAIQKAATQVIDGAHDEHFPVDVFQTGSGTSSNMNCNEVIAQIAQTESGLAIHPNDDVNLGQSSNDTIPTAIHISALLSITETLLPAMQHLHNTLEKKAEQLADIVKTGRTHLMDAMPLTVGQEITAWASQVSQCQQRISDTLIRLSQLAQGGTAIGSGINAHAQFAQKFAESLSEQLDISFKPSDNFFMSLAAQDTAVEVSGQLKTYAVALMKIANDLRWMNSGPLAGLGEIQLEALQPGSSIMPGKVNPVIPEAVCMVAAQVIGNDTTVTIAGQSGNFQLNVMLPVIAYNLLQSIDIMANASQLLADCAVQSFTVQETNLEQALHRNPILVTALNSVIGYEKGASIAKAAYKAGKPIIDIAESMTDLSREELARLLDPKKLTAGGIIK